MQVLKSSEVWKKNTTAEAVLSLKAVIVMKNQYSWVLYNCTLFKLNKGSPVTFSGTSKLKRKPNHSFFYQWMQDFSTKYFRRKCSKIRLGYSLPVPNSAEIQQPKALWYSFKLYYIANHASLLEANDCPD